MTRVARGAAAAALLAVLLAPACSDDAAAAGKDCHARCDSDSECRSPYKCVVGNLGFGDCVPAECVQCPGKCGIKDTNAEKTECAFEQCYP